MAARTASDRENLAAFTGWIKHCDLRISTCVSLTKARQRTNLTPTGKPRPLAVRLEQALPFRRCVGGEDVLWGSPASQTIQKPQAQYHGEARSSGVVPRRVPSLNEECALMHPLQGASFLSTPLQGGILKPPALRVVGDSNG